MSLILLLLLFNFGYTLAGRKISVCDRSFVVLARKTVCEGAAMTLECPIGEKLFIVSANYGRTQPGSDCLSPMAELYVNGRCKLKRRCTLLAYNIFLGNPCRHVHKYLDVSYKCIQIRRVCEVIPMKITCERNRKIHIVDVQFGTRIPDNYACPKRPLMFFKGLDCRSTDSSFFKAMCNMRRSCEILPHAYAEWDSCYAKSKFLELKFSCEEENPKDVIGNDLDMATHVP